jgi:hypothetical protein
MIVYGSLQDGMNLAKFGDLRSLVEGPRRVGHAWRMLQGEAGKGAPRPAPCSLPCPACKRDWDTLLISSSGVGRPSRKGRAVLFRRWRPATLPVQQIPSSLLTARDHVSGTHRVARGSRAGAAIRTLGT